MRTILLKLECKGAAGGCCGKSGRKATNKYALLWIEKIASLGDDIDEYDLKQAGLWNIVKASPLYSNTWKMAKKHATQKPSWAGTVLSLGLDKDPDFMAQLDALKIIKKGCKIVAVKDRKEAG